MPDLADIPTIYWILFGLLIFAAGLFFEPLGLFFALLLFIAGKVLVLIEEGSKKARTFLIVAIKEMLRWGPQALVNDYTDVANVIARDVMFGLAAAAAYGEITNLQALLPYVIGTTGSSVANIDLASVAIFVAVPAFMFALLVEFWNMVPRGFHVFAVSELDKRKRLLYTLRVLLVFLVILSVIASMLLWIYRSVYLSHPEAVQDPTASIQGLPFGLAFSLSDIQFWLFTLIGVLFVFVMGFGAVAAIPGVLGLGATISGAFAGITIFTEFPAYIGVELISIPCFFLSRQRFTPRTKIPDIQFFTRVAGNFEEILPWWRKKSDEDEQALKPIAIGNGEELIMDEKIASFISGGTRANQAISTFNEAAQELRAQKLIRTSGSLTLQGEPDMVITNTIDISPKPPHYAAAIASGARGDSLKQLLYKQMGDHLVREHISVKHQAAPIIVNTDPHEIPPMAEMLTRIAADLPLNAIYLIMSVAKHERSSPALQKALEVIDKLYADGVIAVCSIIDAESYIHADLLRHLAKAIMGLMVMKKQFAPNLSAVEVLEVLRRNGSPYTAMRHSSDTVAATPPPKRWWQKIFGRKSAGDIGNMVTRTKEVIGRLATMPETGSLEAAISFHMPSFILNLAPIPGKDQRRLGHFASFITTFVRQHYQPARALFVRAVGDPNNQQLPSEYMVASSWFYTISLGDVIQIPAIESRLQAKALPEPKQSTNPQMPAEPADVSQNTVQHEQKEPVILAKEDLHEVDTNSLHNGSQQNGASIENKANGAEGREPSSQKQPEETK